MAEDRTALPPLASIREVLFYKRDEITTDLICCDIVSEKSTLFVHEQAPEWDRVIAHVSALPGFDEAWFGKVSQPPLAPSVTVAFRRDG